MVGQGGLLTVWPCGYNLLTFDFVRRLIVGDVATKNPLLPPQVANALREAEGG